MAGSKVHEDCYRCLAKLCRAPKGNFIFAVQFECKQTSGFLGDISAFEIRGIEQS